MSFMSEFNSKVKHDTLSNDYKDGGLKKWISGKKLRAFSFHGKQNYMTTCFMIGKLYPFT